MLWASTVLRPKYSYCFGPAVAAVALRPRPAATMTATLFTNFPTIIRCLTVGPGYCLLVVCTAIRYV